MTLVAKVSLDEASIQQLVDCAWQVSACQFIETSRQEAAPSGFNVINEGDINASFFYIVKRGKQSLAKLGKALRTALRSGKFDVIAFWPWQSFGKALPSVQL